MAETLTLYRLIILYMLDKVDFPLSNTQLTNFVLEKDYTSYFTIQQTFAELQDSDLITAESTHNNTLYRITDAGRQALSFFGDKISDGIKADIAAYFQEKQYQLKSETSVISDYYKTTNGRYGVRCQIKEKDTSIIDLTIQVASKDQALAICQNWKAESDAVYALLMDQLLR